MSRARVCGVGLGALTSLPVPELATVSGGANCYPTTGQDWVLCPMTYDRWESNGGGEGEG